MISFYPALLAAASLVSIDTVFAQSSTYTVHSTVIFARTGEHTPFLGTTNESLSLTSYGASQLYNLGAFFRKRYIPSGAANASDGSVILTGLSSSLLEVDQVVGLTLASPVLAAGAQAFMQGLYPPFTFGSSAAAALLDPSSMLADGSIVNNPLNGFQYPLLNTFTRYDPNMVYVHGETNCNRRDTAQTNYYSGAQYRADLQDSAGLYNSSALAFLLRDLLFPSQQTYKNSYEIYNYVSYQYNHNATVRGLLNSPAYAGLLDSLRAYASKMQYALYGDLSVTGATSNDKILAIAGRTLAAKVVGSLYTNIRNSGRRSKFSVIVGDFEPMISLLSLMGLPGSNDRFAQLPSYGSAMVFELFSWQNGTNVSNSDGANYPPISSLWVRFSFRNTTGNGSTDEDGLRAYPIFNHGPSQLDMPYLQFSSLMQNFMIPYIDVWCKTCQSTAVFCAAFDDTITVQGPGGGVRRARPQRMSPQVGGVIGATVTIGVLLLLLAAAMLLSGIRFHRNADAALVPAMSKRRQSSLGGFKGSAKLASDLDVHITKNASPIGVSVAPADPFNEDGGNDDSAKRVRGHERIGSWELKEKESADARFSSLTGSTMDAGARASRLSFEDRDAIAEEEIDRIASNKPVAAQENV